MSKHNCRVRETTLREWKGTNLWFADDYAGFIYKKIDGQLVRVGRAGSFVEGHKAYDDLHNRKERV